MEGINCFALFALISASNCLADTTTTTTNPDGSTTVVETTEAPSSATAPTRRLIGPTGVTGTIRRSDRRQDRRLEEDL